MASLSRDHIRRNRGGELSVWYGGSCVTLYPRPAFWGQFVHGTAEARAGVQRLLEKYGNDPYAWPLERDPAGECRWEYLIPPLD